MTIRKLTNFEKALNPSHLSQSPDCLTLPDEISGSALYLSLHEVLGGTPSAVTCSQWDELLRLVDSVYPGFSGNLSMLLGGLNETELRVCLLIKCGFSPSQIARLTNKSASAISSCRIRMAKRALPDAQSAPLWDDFVRAL